MDCQVLLLEMIQDLIPDLLQLEMMQDLILDFLQLELILDLTQGLIPDLVQLEMIPGQFVKEVRLVFLVSQEGGLDLSREEEMIRILLLEKGLMQPIPLERKRGYQGLIAVLCLELEEELKVRLVVELMILIQSLGKELMTKALEVELIVRLEEELLLMILENEQLMGEP
jgi:hypothetical protein